VCCLDGHGLPDGLSDCAADSPSHCPSFTWLDGDLIGLPDGLFGGLFVDVSVQVSAQSVGVLMKSRVHDGVYGMYMLPMADNTTLLAGAGILIKLKNVESNSMKVVEADYGANNG